MINKTSPFVSVQSGEDAFKIHAHLQGTGKLSISVDKLGEPSDTYSDLAGVEDYFIDTAPTTDIVLTLDNPKSPVEERQVNAVALGISIMRAANEIAQRQRRGMGNVVLMHPDTAKMLGVDSPLPLAQITEPSAKVTKGRWELAGKLNYSIEVYTSVEMAKDKVAVAYVGNNPFDCSTTHFNEAVGLFEVFPKFSTADEHLCVLTLTYE